MKNSHYYFLKVSLKVSLLALALLIGLAWPGLAWPGLTMAFASSDDLSRPSDFNGWETLGKLLTAIVIPFVVNLISTVKWPGWSKLMLTGVVSILAAIANEGIAGHLSGDNVWLSLSRSIMEILIAAWAFYQTVFKSVIEPAVFPKEAIVTEIKKQAQAQVSAISTQQAHDVVNPAKADSFSSRAVVQ